MKIISPFTDYYDHHARDTDPKILFNRKDFEIPWSHNHSFTVYGKHNILGLPEPISDLWKVPTKHYRLAWLVINLRKYLIISFDGYYRYNYKLANRHNMDEFYKKGDKSDSSYKKHYSNLEKLLEESGQIDEKLLPISKLVKQPIYIILDTYSNNYMDRHYVTITQQMPILKNIGISSIISSEQLFSETEYFISNYLNENPDTIPPVEIGNNDKIVGHGFDLKQSFRHRR